MRWRLRSDDVNYLGWLQALLIVLLLGWEPAVAQPAPAKSPPAPAVTTPAPTAPAATAPAVTAPAATAPAPAASAPASRGQAVSAEIQARIDQAVLALGNDPRFKQIPQARLQGAVEFVVGQMLFSVLHEMGHAMVTEMELPVLGKEEDAADAFAITTILKVGNSFSRRVLVESAEGWYLSDLRDQKEGLKPAFYDSHSLDKQRAFWIVCLMVGSDPVKFKDLANEAKLPASRQESCLADYGNASWSWGKSLKPYQRAADQPKTKISVVYGDTNGDLDLYASVLRSVRLMEIIAEHAEDQFVWRNPFTIELKTCGRSNAYWLFSTHTVTVCYELAKEFAELYRDYREQFDKTAALP